MNPALQLVILGFGDFSEPSNAKRNLTCPDISELKVAVERFLRHLFAWKLRFLLGKKNQNQKLKLHALLGNICLGIFGRSVCRTENALRKEFLQTGKGLQYCQLEAATKP